MSASFSSPRARATSSRRKPARLREAARGKAKVVAVTVDADDAFLDEIVAPMQPDMLQLHGTETPERVAEVKARYGLPVMKAFSVSEAADLEADRALSSASPTASCSTPSRRKAPSCRAATASSFDWRLLAGLDAGVDYMLSGGLNAANIGDALRLANPPGIDISSGVESAPGVKDLALIEQFLPGRAGGNRRPRRLTIRASMSNRRSAMNKPATPNSFRTGPDEQGMFGIFGGRFVAETLMPLILDLRAALERGQERSGLQGRAASDLDTHYAGRPSPLYFAERPDASISAAPRSTSSARS